MKIFVTGASGFVGGAAAKRLVADGHEVVAMSRSAASDAKIAALGAAPVRCDLESIDASHVEGCDALIHSAAFVEEWGPRDAWYKSNVLGTKAVLDAAKAAGVGRFIHIGTEAAIVHGQDVDNADESVPLAPWSTYPYCATKAMAEQLVRDANGDGFVTIVLRPRLIWGPGDQTILPAIEKMARDGQFAWIDRGEVMTSSTHIANLVEAIVLALGKGHGGEAYFILDDGQRSMRDVMTGLAGTRGITLPDRNIPSAVARPAAALLEKTWRLFSLKGAPPVTRQAVMLMSCNCTLNDAKARAELGYAPVISFEQGLAELAGRV